MTRILALADEVDEALPEVEPGDEDQQCNQREERTQKDQAEHGAGDINGALHGSRQPLGAASGSAGVNPERGNGRFLIH